MATDGPVSKDQIKNLAMNAALTGNTPFLKGLANGLKKTSKKLVI